MLHLIVAKEPHNRINSATDSLIATRIKFLRALASLANIEYLSE